MREASWSLVPTAKCGLRRVGACHQRVLSRPPPPRFVGLDAHFSWASATPAEASICAAMGAVRPRPTISCTKRRRESRPAFTSPTSALSPCSSMDILRGVSCLVIPVGEAPERRVPAREIHAPEPRARRGDAVAPQERDDHDVLDHEIVHLDEERRALDRVELDLRRPVDPIVLLAAPARDVAPLPLVRLRRDLPQGELVHEVPGIARRTPTRPRRAA